MTNNPPIAMKPLTIFEHVFCYITLGLICGWYQFLLVSVPICLYYTYRGSLIPRIILALGVILTITPLTHKPWRPFTRSWIFRLWIKYFDMEFFPSEEKIDGREHKFICFEFPHGVFPIGQLLSAYCVDDVWPGETICGTGADIIFKVPVMRQIMAWVGTHPASRKNITKILGKGYHCAVIPGGIAEMFLISETEEHIFLRPRKNTVKAAIQEGAHIIPVFFFGNSKLFTIVTGQGSDSWLARLSRRLRMSLFFFYGRHYLPVPYRHPLRMVTGDIVRVTKIENPTDEQVAEVHDKVIAAVQKLYDTKKPDWETRPLVIS